MSNPGQVALGIVGGIVGAYVGGPQGALYGFQLGLAVGTVVSPTQLPGTFGPRLNDNRTTLAQMGGAISYVWGNDVVAGTVIWLGDVVEHSNTEELGGKGGPQQASTTYSYTQSIAIGLCKGPQGGMRRVWENGKLVYDARAQLAGESDSDYDARVTAASEYATKFTLYLGGESQLPDPTIEAKEGLGNVPGYRGLMYIVYTDRELTQEQGQRQPSFKFELAPSDTQAIVALASSVSGPASGKFVMTSDDGAVTWTMRSTPGSGWIALASAPGLKKIIAVDSTAAGAVMQSLDTGITWALLGSGIGQACRDVAWSEELGVFVAISSNAIYKSADGGATWAAQTEPAGYTYQAVVWVPGALRFVVQAIAPGSVGGELYSADGSTWVAAATPRGPGTFTSNTGGIATDGVGALQFGCNLGETFHTSDGNTWTAGASAASSSEPGGAHASGGSAAPGEYVLPWTRLSSNVVTKTVDNGLHWTGPVSGLLPRDVSEVIYTQGKYILVYTTTTVLSGPTVLLSAVATSSDGLNWTARVTPTAADSAAWSDMAVAYADPPVNAASLAVVVADICRACGLEDADIDVTDLTTLSVIGYQVSRVCDGRSAIAVLRQIGFFDAVESGRQVKFVRRGKATVRTLTTAQLGAHENGSEPPPLVTTRLTQDVELPRQLFVAYREQARDYEPGQQASPTRLITDAVNDVYIDVACVIDATTAAKAAEVIWADMWAARWQHTLDLDGSQTALEATDCVLCPVDGRLERLRIVSTEDSAIVLRKLALVRDDDGAYVSTAIADAPAVPPQVLVILAASEVVLLDLPALRIADDDPGIYAAAVRGNTGTRWPGLSIYRGLPGATLDALASIANEAVVGELSAPLASGPHTVFDEGNVIEVELERGAFESRPDEDLLELGANMLAIGVHGRWELVQFLDADQVGPTSWELSGLLRGRRGTERNIGSALLGDTVVLVSGAGLVRLPLNTANVGEPFAYRAVTIGATLGSGSEQEFTGAGEALTPFSAVHVTATDVGGDLLIEWVRRDRLAVTFTDPLPLSEAVEAYEVDIVGDSSPATVLRTISSATPSVTYTAAQQAADFGGPTPTSLAVRIYQIGALGRGHVAEAIL